MLVAPPAPLSFSHLLYKDLGYDPTKFVPITMLAKIPNVLVVRKELPAASLKELVEQWLDPAILGQHQHGERRLGGAPWAGDVAAQGLGRLVARRRERAAAGDRAARERPCELGGQAARDAGLGQALDQQEEIGRTAAGHRGDRVHQVLVVDPMNRADRFHERAAELLLGGPDVAIGDHRGDAPTDRGRRVGHRAHDRRGRAERRLEAGDHGAGRDRQHDRAGLRQRLVGRQHRRHRLGLDREDDRARRELGR